ncbi:hypothetical protein NB600_00195 [Vibrio antiquarius]|uniref:hypothetical protein n=1 Tax=Vibrio antiquarius (strain Ex25) TaxID=150340 RepID=UPI00265D51FD|nr:hypothetical protein [Vibrio antiquarius]MCR9684248.1 hypothetical protein [Vibrio antiquarius]
MKYNKQEQRAIDALYAIASNLKEGKPTSLESGDLTAIQNVLGINFHGATKTKTEVKKDYRFVRGKGDLMLSYSFYSEGWCDRYCYFPFQLKRKEEKGA